LPYSCFQKTFPYRQYGHPDAKTSSQGEVSPGAQLFILASTLYALELYPALSQPNGNPGDWQASIIS
jgi:hypothetical protein